MTGTAEVIIAGAGILGVSTAYHLARLGVAMMALTGHIYLTMMVT